MVTQGMRSFAAAGLGLALCVVSWSATVAEGPKSGISLRWALAAWAGKDGAPESIRADARLAAGTRLKFLVEPTSPSTVYLILQGTDKTIQVLYRESPRFEDKGGAKPSYIPPGGRYFELDDAAGLDTFFLLASAEPLVDLEQLLDRYGAAADAAKPDLASQIVQEIRRQHKAHREFSRPIEKPVIIGGQTRGGDGSPTAAVDRLATEVKAEGFYSKTISIGH